MTDVYLECVKVKSKLRVRITSPGYYKEANCMFPRDLRVEGRKFKTNSWNINLITSRGKYYYTVGKSSIETLTEAAIVDLSNLKVFEDTSTDECAICMSEPKSVIINPCGHYYMCNTCSGSVKTCPICRGQITSLVAKADMD